MNSQPALDISDLVKEFKPSKDFREKHPEALTEAGLKRAVNGISFKAYPGEVTVLLGANGAGKTTTLACAQGLTKRDGGTISLLGEDPWGASPQLRARVGIMLQDGGLPQSVRPLPLLRHVAAMYANPLDISELSQRLGIDSFNGTSIRRLSGGQRQRVALAAALVGRPDVLFLDEPSAGLDPQSRQVVFDIIEEQKQRGVAIVLTTHLLDDAQRLADYVYIVERGQNVVEGTVADLLTRAADETKTITFTVARENLTLTDLLSGSGQPFSLVNRGHGSYQLSGPLKPSTLTQLMRSFEQLDLMPTHLELTPRTLEDVFLDIAGREIR
ncbi:ABC transporter ATP-binding protein [Rothia aerolata]|uniref:ABC transporter ATP-binding protein n=1 Tax=Rothia aerolata TaxID=1812262 RepID=A0A917IM48_9MICC|nr:ABC transporter ATP-binding protein [Rothia aerolata]GGH57249.1 ABC transporter ATP-binding protein [Rothia aerolata]